MLFHDLASILMAVAGHSLAQRPHPTQRPSSTTEKLPFQMLIASLGQTSAQAPQATQTPLSTTAWRLALTGFPEV